MADSTSVKALTLPGPWLHKLFLTSSETELSLESRPPKGDRPSTLALIAVTTSGPRVVKAVSGRALLRITVAHSELPAECQEGSGRYASLSDPTDFTAPGVYAALWVGAPSVPPLSKEQWEQMVLEGARLPPVGATLAVISGASLEPGGVIYPISSMGVEFFWAVSSTSAERMAMAVVSPLAPPMSDGAFLARRGRLAVVVAPTWTLSPGAPVLGFADLSQLVGEEGETVTVRRFAAGETESVSVSVDPLEGTTAVAEALPSAITIQGIEFNAVEATWREDGTLKLVALQEVPVAP